MEGSGIGHFNISAGARKYFFIPGFYAGANLVLATFTLNNEIEVEDDDDDDADAGAGAGAAATYKGKSSGHSFGVELNAGYTYYLSKHFAIEPSVSFMYGLSTKMEDMKANLSVFSLNIGFVYTLDNVISFNKKKPASRKK